MLGRLLNRDERELRVLEQVRMHRLWCLHALVDDDQTLLSPYQHVQHHCGLCRAALLRRRR